MSDLETLPILNLVSVVAGTLCSRSAKPKARLQTTAPSRMTQIEAPGAPRIRMVSVMNRSTARTASGIEGLEGAGCSVGEPEAHPSTNATAAVEIPIRDQLIGNDSWRMVAGSCRWFERRASRLT